MAEATFKADIKFKTKARVTKRTVDVSEAFGIGIDDEHHFVVYDNFTVEINKGGIVYLTGDSGSGKSLLLKQLTVKMSKSKEFGKVITDKEIEEEIDPRKSLVEQVGKDTGDAIRILSIAGLNEAFLMLRKYKELSDGQKYRFRLAKMIDCGADTWVTDEFVALLDRTTAKVVAYTIQKAARKLGKTVIVATTHTDLDQDLNPSIRIFKHFGSKVDVDYRKINPKRPCSLLKKIIIEKGSIEDYNRLKQFHYRDSQIRLVKAIYRAVLNGEVIGVIVYGSPHLNLRVRSIVLPSLKKQENETLSDHAKRVNKNIVRIWRVVVDPKYRGTGIASLLVKNTMPLLNMPYVEVLAVMARYSKFFDAAGMLRVPEEFYLHYDKAYEKSLEMLRSFGFDLELLSSKNHNIRILRSLPKGKVEQVRDIALKHFVADKFRKPVLKEALLQYDLESIAKALTGKRLPYAYLIWKNPRFKNKPDPIQYCSCFDGD